MKKLLVLASIIVLFINCNDSAGSWSLQDRQKGLKKCTEAAAANLDEATAKKICNCALEKTMRKYKSYDEADEKVSDEEGQEIVQACVALVQGGKVSEDEDKGKGGIFGGGGGWSGPDKRKYLNECTPAAANTGISEQAATTYCNCTLKKFEKKYKSYADAQNNLTQAELTRIQQECAAGNNGDDEGSNDENN